MDLADQIDDYICTIDGVGDLTMDTLAMVVFGWATGGLLVVVIGKFLYTKYVARKNTAITGAAAAETKVTKTSVLGTSATTDDLLNKNARELSKDRVSGMFVLESEGKESYWIVLVLGGIREAVGRQGRCNWKSHPSAIRRSVGITDPARWNAKAIVKEESWT